MEQVKEAMSSVKVDCPGCGNIVSAGNVLDSLQTDGSYTHTCGHRIDPKRIKTVFNGVAELYGWTKSNRRRSLSGGMVDWLLALMELGGRATAGDIAQTVMRMGSRTGAGGGDGAKTAWWGLAQKSGKSWTLTDKGRDFLIGVTSVPKYCDSNGGKLSGPNVSVFDVRRSKPEVAGVNTEVQRLPEETVAYVSSEGRNFA